MAAPVIDIRTFASASRANVDRSSSVEDVPLRKKDVFSPSVDMKFLLGRLKDMKSEQDRYRPHWEDIGRYIMPRHSHYLRSKRADGGKYNDHIINSHATKSVRRAVAGFQSGMTPRTRPWFLFQPDHGFEQEENHHDVKRWANRARDVVFAIMQRSNFYQSTQVCYTDFVPYGVGCIQIDESPGPEVIATRVHPIGSYYIDVDEEGRPDTFARRYNWTLKQIIDKFGIDAIPSTLRAQAEHALGSKHDVMYMILPNKDYAKGTKLGAKGMPYLSVWWISGHEHTHGPVRVGGYHEFPVMVPRFWKVGEEAWAQSPGMDALPDVKALQKEESLYLLATELQVLPPLAGPGTLREDVLRRLPGSYTAITGGEAGSVGSLYEVRTRLADLTNSIAKREAMISDIFFEPIFTAIMDTARRQRTLGEVEKIESEKFMMLGPVLENIIDDLLEPAVSRIYNIAERRGLIGEIPESVVNQPVRVTFVSILAQAQKALKAVGVEQTLAFVTNLAEVFPEMRHRVDVDEAIETYADATDATDILTSRDDAQAAREQEAAAAQRNAQLAQAQALAASARDAASAQLSEPSALSAIADQFAGGRA